MLQLIFAVSEKSGLACEGGILGHDISDVWRRIQRADGQTFLARVNGTRDREGLLKKLDFLTAATERILSQ
jgi:hypothetical protein